MRLASYKGKTLLRRLVYNAKGVRLLMRPVRRHACETAWLVNVERVDTLHFGRIRELARAPCPSKRPVDKAPHHAETQADGGEETGATANDQGNAAMAEV